MLLFEQFLLLEDRIDVLRDKFKPLYMKILATRVANNIDRCNELYRLVFDLIQNIDPTPNKIYMQWLLQSFSKFLESNISRTMTILTEDGQAISEDLSIYNRVKSRMPLDQRDINRFTNYMTLRIALLPYREVVSKTQEDKQLVDNFYKTGQITIVYRGPEGKIEIPHTIEASKHLGRGTRWCTAAEKNNYFSQYNRQGKLYVITESAGAKFQAHVETNSFMDDQDRSIGLDTIRQRFEWAVQQIFKYSKADMNCMIKSLIGDGINFLTIGIHWTDLKQYWKQHPKLLEIYSKLFEYYLPEIESILKPILKQSVYTTYVIENGDSYPYGMWSDERELFKSMWPHYSRIEFDHITTMRSFTPLAWAYMDVMRKNPNLQTKLYVSARDKFTDELCQYIKPFCSTPHYFFEVSRSITHYIELMGAMSNIKFKKMWLDHWSKMYHFANNNLLSGKVSKVQAALGTTLLKISMANMILK